MTHARRLAALAAIAFFAVLNAGTSQQPAATPGPAPTPSPAVAPPTPSAPYVRTCQRPDGRCMEVRITPIPGWSEQQSEMAERMSCEQTARGTWGQTPCPTANLIGRCTLPGGNVYLYYSPSWSPADAQSTCQLVTGASWAPN